MHAAYMAMKAGGSDISLKIFIPDNTAYDKPFHLTKYMFYIIASRDHIFFLSVTLLSGWGPG